MSKKKNNKNLLSLILAVIIIAAVFLLPKLTGKSIGELLGGKTEEQTQTESVISVDTNAVTESSQIPDIPAEDGRALIEYCRTVLAELLPKVDTLLF